jgi:hypothetical protein
MVDLTADEFPWLVKIWGYLIELKSKVVINSTQISVVSDSQITMSNGESFDITPEELDALWMKMGCPCIDLEARSAFLQSKNIPCEDYKKL